MCDMTSPVIDSEKLAWMSLSPGVWVRPLRLEGEERSLQLRVEPGTRIEPHRHAGSVNAYGVSGYRRLGSGTIAGPGSYVFEPEGNCDTWACEGDEDCIVQISMSGRLTDLRSESHTDTANLKQRYLAWCAAEGIAPAAIGCRE